MLKRIKNALLGGNFSYYITRDRNYFIKICKGDLEWIVKEYNNLIKFRNMIDIKNLQLAVPIKYSEEKEYLITKYIDGKRLIDLLDPKIYYHFGKLLKKFHNKGFSHSHIELTDVIYKDGKFTLVDVPFFNEKKPIHDLVTIAICIKTFRLKSPWNWYKFNVCYKEFFKGYGLEDKSSFKREYKQSFYNRTKYMMKLGFKNKIKSYIMIFFYKIGLQ